MFTFQKQFFNNKGSILFLLPFLISIFSSLLLVGGLLSISKQQYQQQYKCQYLGIKIQSIYSRLANDLEALNPKARSLQNEYKRAMSLVKSAPDPKTKAAALAYLKLVKIRQLSFHLIQKKLILANTSEANIVAQSADISPKDQIPRKLYFKKMPPYSLSPEYVADSDFYRKQQFIKTWTKNTFFSNKKVIGKCEVILTKEKRWFTKIRKDKV